MFKMIINAINSRRNLKAEMNETIEVTARNYDTNEVETFTLDKIAYRNWMMGNDMCEDYEVLNTRKVG